MAADLYEARRARTQRNGGIPCEGCGAPAVDCDQDAVWCCQACIDQCIAEAADDVRVEPGEYILSKQAGAELGRTLLAEAARDHD